MKASCERCNGKGSLYTRIAGDVHIADCPDCEGYGTITLKQVQAKQSKPKEPYRSFGAIDLDAILRE